MNPLVIDLLGSLLRWALNGLGMWLVARRVWTEGQASAFANAGAAALVPIVLGCALSLGSLLWSQIKSYTKRLKLVTALALPAGMTELDVEHAIKSPTIQTPSTATQKDEVPRAIE